LKRILENLTTKVDALDDADEAAGATLVLVLEAVALEVTLGVVIFGRLEGLVVELSTVRGCGLLTFPVHTKLPLIAT